MVWAGLVCDWLHHQRCLRRLCLLPEDRVRQLEALGIEWNLTLTERDRTWEQKFRELLEFRLQHGHCAVPPNWKLNPSLAAWLNKQQEKIKAGELPTARHIQLIAAGVKTN